MNDIPAPPAVPVMDDEEFRALLLSRGFSDIRFSRATWVGPRAKVFVAWKDGYHHGITADSIGWGPQTESYP